MAVKTQYNFHCRPAIQQTPFVAVKGRKARQIAAIKAELLKAVMSPIKIWSDFALCANRERPIIAAATDKDSEALVKELGFNYVLQTVPGNTHPLARTARLVAERVAFDILFKKTKDSPVPIHLVDWYGSQRTVATFRSSTDWLAADPILKKRPGMTLDWYRPIITAKDHIEYGTALTKYPSVDLKRGDWVLAIDVYALSPQEMMSQWIDAGVERGVVVTQVFHSDVVAGVNFKTGVYYQAGGKVLQAPSPGDSVWPTGEPNDFWIRTSSYSYKDHTVVWDLSRRVADYYVISFSITAKPLAARVQEFIPYPAGAVLIRAQIPYCSWWALIRHWIQNPFRRDATPYRELVVHWPSILKMSDAQVLKTRQAYQLSMLIGQIRDLAKNDEFLWASVPLQKASVIEDTATFIMWARFTEENQNWTAVRDTYGGALQAFRKVRSKMDPPPLEDRSHLWKVVGVIGLIGAAALIARFYVIPKGLEIQTALFDSARTCLRLATRNVRLLIGNVSEWLRPTPSLKAPSFKIQLPPPLTIPNGTLAPLPAPLVMPEFPTCPVAAAGLSASSAFTALRALFTSVVTPAIAGNMKGGLLASIGLLFLEMVGALVPGFLGKLFLSTDTFVQYGAWWNLLPLSLAPYWEELMKRKYPLWATVVIAFWEGLTFPLMNMGYFTKPLYEIPFRLSVHYAMERTDYPEVVHSCWNLAAMVRSMIAVQSVYPLPWYLWLKQPHFLCPTLALLMSFRTLLPTEPEPPKYATWERFVELHAAAKLNVGNDLSDLVLPEFPTLPSCTRAFEQEFDYYEGLPDTAPQYVLLSTRAAFVRPKGYGQFLRAYKERNLCPVFITPTCEDPADLCKVGIGQFVDVCPVSHDWAIATGRFAPFLRADLDEAKMTRLEWAARFNESNKRARAYQAILDRQEDGVRPRSGIFLKSDEVLYPKPGWKGRTVKAVDPTVQAECAPHVDYAMRALKKCVNHKVVIPANKWSATFSVGSGMLSSDLDKWFARSFDWVVSGDKRAACIFAGDDFFAIMSYEGRVQYVENDYSKYDRTQGAHALESEGVLIRKLGFPMKSWKLLLKSLTSTARFEDKRLGVEMQCPMPIQRATGGPDTTLGNTLLNMVAIYFALTECDTNFPDFPRIIARLGFECKTKIHDEPSLATFLKGWWLPTPLGHFVWLPLPSQAVKLGKILTDPRVIYKHLEPSVAWKAAARAMALGFGTVPREYPLFGHFLWKYETLTDVDVAAQIEFHKIVVNTTVLLDIPAVRDVIEQRYGISHLVQLEMEHEILYSEFPGVLIHDAWIKVAQVDYA